MAETSTQRPWTDVIRRDHNDFIPSARVAQYAAMAHAYCLSHELAIEDSPYWDLHEVLEGPADDHLMAIYRQHGAPWAAAFAAAALFDGWDSDKVNTYLNSSHLMVTQVTDWLRAAGIDPDEIAPAASDLDAAERARSLAVRLEQENVELLRLLTDLATEAADLDAWPSTGRTRALKAAQDHLAAVTG